MQGLPAPKTQDLIERINALQTDSLYFVRLDELSERSRECRRIRAEIDALFKVDAAAAWEVCGAWHALAGDSEETLRAFSASIALKDTGTNYINLAINAVGVGMFSAAQEACASLESQPGELTTHAAVAHGIAFCCGALAASGRFATKAEAMKHPLPEEPRRNLAAATEMLRHAGISERDVARHLDLAGAILRKHHMRVAVEPRVTEADGFFRGVTYALHVPVSASEAFEMNLELASAELEAGVDKTLAFDVVFEALS